jgi:DNA-binding transcriptional LysR family regulator
MPTPVLISRLRVKHLELFRHVAEQHTLRRAAELSHMTQPAATKLVQELEDIVKAPLFVRDKRGMKPTLHGEVMYRHVTLLLADMERMAQELALVTEGGEGHIRLGVLPSLAPGLLTRSISLMLEMHPRVRFTVREASTNDLLRSLERNELDVAFARVQDRAAADTLQVTRVYSEPFAVVVRKSHPLSRVPARKRWEALSKAVWVLPEMGTPMRAMMDEVFVRHAALRPATAVECTALEKVLDLIAGSDMVGVLPRSFVLHAERGSRLALLQGDIPFAPTSLVSRRQIQAAPVMGVFARTVQMAARELRLR